VKISTLPEEPELHPQARPLRVLSPRFALALQFASELHAWQTRKQTPVPYMSHLMAVSSLVLEHGGDEDQAIAALLHDAIEDQIDDYRGDLKADIRASFGERVLRIVEECSDSQVSTGKPKWRERKERYLAHLEQISSDAALVSVADKLHNARNILGDYREIGEKLWSRFSGGKEGTLWYYDTLAKRLAKKAPPRLARELEEVVAEIHRLSGGA